MTAGQSTQDGHVKSIFWVGGTNSGEGSRHKATTLPSRPSLTYSRSSPRRRIRLRRAPRSCIRKVT